MKRLIKPLYITLLVGSFNVLATSHHADDILNDILPNQVKAEVIQHLKDQLFSGVRSGNIKKVAQALQHNASVNLTDEHGQTALHIAVLLKEKKIAKLLIKHGANLEAKDNEGSTPLHLAARICSDKMAKMLLKRGAKINAKDNNGHKPTYVAEHCGVMMYLRLQGERTEYWAKSWWDKLRGKKSAKKETAE